MRIRLGKESARKKKLNTIEIWWKAIRFHFVPPSFLPAILGGIIVWANYGIFEPWYFLLTVIGVTINHLGLNMADDYYDYKHNVDSEDDEKNPYTGGSGVLTEGLIKAETLIRASFLCFFITAIIGIYLAIERGILILAFLLIGLFSSYFYTAPPIKFGYRGFGELGLLVNFGPIIGLGSYYVMAQKLAIEPFLATLPLGFMMWSMITINEIPDYDTDKKSGKMNLVARFGRGTGIYLYILGLIAAYLTILLSAIFLIIPLYALISFATVPIALRSIRILKENYKDRMKMIPANIDMIKVHNLTGVLLIISYILMRYV